MAKIKHNNFIDTVDEIFAGAKKEGVLHLYAEDQYLNGRTIQIKGKEITPAKQCKNSMLVMK
jgi:hypothetical protein